MDFPFLIECLKKFKYPNVHSMDDMEIADVFSNSNKQFLVSWILKQIDEDYKEFVENASKEDLADIVYQNGFCRNSEKIKFMNGECDIDTQFKILYKMFTYMNSLSDIENSDEMKPLSKEELKDLLEFDTNLFPVYGNKQTLTSAKRATKIQEYKKEIEQLKNLIDSKRSKEVKRAPSANDLEKESISSGMKDLEMNLSDFKRIALKLSENRINGADSKSIHFKENFTDLMEMSNKKATVISNFIEDTNVILDFTQNKENNEMDVKTFNNRNNKSRSILRDISGLCNDVIIASKTD